MSVSVIEVQLAYHVYVAVVMLALCDLDERTFERMGFSIILELAAKTWWDMLQRMCVMRGLRILIGIGIFALFSFQWTRLVVMSGDVVVAQYALAGAIVVFVLVIYNLFNVHAYRRFMTINFV